MTARRTGTQRLGGERRGEPDDLGIGTHDVDAPTRNEVLAILWSLKAEVIRV